MALGGVFIKDIDGNIPYNSGVVTDSISGILFDTSKFSAVWEKGVGKERISELKDTVIYLTNLKEAEALGIVARAAVVEGKEEEEVNFFYGIPHYHIKKFFETQGANGRLYVMFTDCSSGWSAIETMQRCSGGLINQVGVYTGQSLWTNADDLTPTYTVSLVNSLQTVAENLAKQNQPLSVLLSANSAVLGSVETNANKINLTKIPTCIGKWSRVSVLLSQSSHTSVSEMQLANELSCPIGFIGIALGCLAKARVHESLAWVQMFNVYADDLTDIELGFGDTTLTEGKFASTLSYQSLSPVQLDDLDDKGYIFLCKYSGQENGIYVSKDRTCSDGDFRTIARNRTINKSRRSVRKSVLPYVNGPVLVDPNTGYLSAAKITSFKNIVGDVLKGMQTAGEISGYKVDIPATQNVLVNDTLLIKYSIVPIGVATVIDVEEGLSLTSK